MSFVYPSFLWALTALSIPIIIHLFNFRKTTRIYFSSNRFLRLVQEATSAKRKLKHYLILASRLLFLFLLVMAFAQPFIPAVEQLSSDRTVFVYLDNSLSMSVPVAEKTRALDEGISRVKQLVEIFPADSRYQLVTNDFAPFSNSYKSKVEILDLLTQIRLSPVSRSFDEINDKIKNVSRSKLKKDIFWISDLQRSTLGDLSGVRIDSTDRLHLVPLEIQAPTNIFIDTVYLENPFVVGGEKNTLFVKLRNDGDRAIEQLLIKLSVNGIQSGTSSVNIAAKGTTVTSFDLVTGLSGTSRVVISFNDYPVSFDNEFYLALNFSDKIRVVEVKGGQASSSLAKVFGNSNVFQFRSFNVSNFTYSVLSGADLVIINALDRIEVSFIQSLRSYIGNFGSLLVIPSLHPDIEAYKNLLALPSLKLIEETTQAELDLVDFNNPFFENVFEEKTARIVMPKAKRALDWGIDRVAILKTKGDQPYLSQFSQNGKIFLLASPLLPEYTDFNTNFLFLPVMYRVAASGKKSETKPYYNLTESLISLRMDSLVGEQPVRLVGDKEVIPSQRKLSNRILLELPRFTMNAGFYRVINESDSMTLLAFNLDSRESLLAQSQGEEIKQQLGGPDNVSIFNSGPDEAFSNEIKERYLGKPFWKYALMMALFFLLMEILLIRFLK